MVTRKDRMNFRQTKSWKEFRLARVEEQEGRCELCGQKYYGKQKKALQLHHLDPASYDDLQPHKFILLCGNCHDAVESLSVKILGAKADNLKRKEYWILLFWPAIPFAVRAVIFKKWDALLSASIPAAWEIMRQEYIR